MTALAAPSPDAPSPDAAPSRAGAWARPEMEEDLAVLGLLRDACLAVALAVRAEVDKRAGGDEPVQAPAAPPQPLAGKARGPVEGPVPGPAERPPIFTGDPILAMHRAARAVRMTCALRARLVEEIEALDELQTRRHRHRLAEAREARKARIASLLTRIIEDETLAPEAGDDDDAPDLSAEASAEAEAEAGETEAGEREGRETESEAADAYDRLVFEANERLEDRERFGDVLDQPISAFVDAVCRDLGLSPDWPRLAREAWAKEEIASGKVGAPLKNPPSPSMGNPKGRREAANGSKASVTPSTSSPHPEPVEGRGRARRNLALRQAQGEVSLEPPPPPRPPPAAAAPAPPDPFQPPPRPRPPNVLSPDWGWTPTRS